MRAVSFSPSGVEAACADVDSSWWRGVRKAAIGQTTAEAMSAAGWKVGCASAVWVCYLIVSLVLQLDAVAAKPTPAALLEAILSAINTQPTVTQTTQTHATTATESKAATPDSKAACICYRCAPTVDSSIERPQFMQCREKIDRLAHAVSNHINAFSLSSLASHFPLPLCALIADYLVPLKRAPQYFVIKAQPEVRSCVCVSDCCVVGCGHFQDVEASQCSGIWATQPRNVAKLNEAFQVCFSLSSVCLSGLLA